MITYLNTLNNQNKIQLLQVIAKNAYLVWAECNLIQTDCRINLEQEEQVVRQTLPRWVVQVVQKHESIRQKALF